MLDDQQITGDKIFNADHDEQFLLACFVSSKLAMKSKFRQKKDRCEILNNHYCFADRRRAAIL